MVWFISILCSIDLIETAIPSNIILYQYTQYIMSIAKLDSKTLECVFQILFNMIFMTLTYYMSGIPIELFRFGLYSLVGMIVSFVAEGLGLAIGAAFSITVSSVSMFYYSENKRNRFLNLEWYSCRTTFDSANAGTCHLWL